MAGGQAVAARRRRARADALDLGEAAVQEDGIGELAAIAVAGADGFGEPAELAAAAGLALDPAPVVPAERPPRQGAVVLTRARRPGGPVHRDVQLVAAVETTGEGARDESAQARRHGGADDERRPTFAGGRVEVEQVAHVVDRSAGGHHVGPGGEQPRRRVDVRAWRRQDDDIGREVPGDQPQRRRKVAAHALADDARADNGDRRDPVGPAGHRSSGDAAPLPGESSTGCQPPC